MEPINIFPNIEPDLNDEQLLATCEYLRKLIEEQHNRPIPVFGTSTLATR